MEFLLQIAKYLFLAGLLGFVYALYRAILREMREPVLPPPEHAERAAEAQARPAPGVFKVPAAGTSETRPPPVHVEAEQTPAGPATHGTVGADRSIEGWGPRLVVEKSPDPDRLKPGTVFVLGDETWLGRATDNSVALPDRFASLRHAVLTLRDGTHVLRDVGSTNGTFLNGVRLSAEAPLTEGDRIEIGTTLLVYRR
ncbi:MAG: FHA domain-containing protein [Armatimonadota bacterium]